VVVRAARDDELDAVGALTVAAYLGDGLLTADADYAHRLADARSRAREAELYVAEEAGTLLGSVTFCAPGTPYAELARDGEGEFRMLSVAPAARGRGIAEALVRHCLARSRELGHSAVVLCSMREMTTAHRLYARLGFQRLPERDWSPVAGIELLAYRRSLCGTG
jgi:ribosomal protein S18 acetylase RimI-like enzyme